MVIKIPNRDLTEMARVGYVDGFELYVNTDDSGDIPHFHYRDPVDWYKFHTCICIESPNYFIHGNKNDKLNAKQKKSLQEFLAGPVKSKRYKNQFNNTWELVCFLWDLNNSHRFVDDNVEMPNYLELE